MKINNYKLHLLKRIKIIKKTGCWIWQAVVGNRGYGQVGYKGDHHAYVHRVSHTEFIGPIPKGLYVLHSCDNKLCINPLHLRAGTQKENMADAIARGRFTPGLYNKRAAARKRKAARNRHRARRARRVHIGR